MIGTIVQFILLMIAHSIAGIYSSTLKYSKRTTYIIWGTWVIFQTGLLCCTEFIMTNLARQFFIGFILSLIGQYVIFFLTTTGRLAQRVFTMLSYSIFFCIFMTLFTMIQGAFPNMHPILPILINIVMLSAIVYYFLRHVCSLCTKASRDISTGWAPLIFVNVVFLITVILSSVFPVRLTSFKDPAFVTFIFLSVSIMAVYPVIFSSISNMSEAAVKREVETQNKLLLAQIDAESAQLAAESQARHDRRHHNLVMLEFANNNDIEGVREYLKNLVEVSGTASSEVRYCDNMTVGTVLSVYERRAKEEGITVNVSAIVSRDLAVSPKDLVIVIANLFENAIIATSKLKNKEKLINISIKESAQRLLIKVENTCKDRLSFDQTHYGVGIRSVISTATRYDGMYDFNIENGIFSAKISLNLK